MQAFLDVAELRAPNSLENLLLYRLWRAAHASSYMVTRMVEGGFGVTRREWGMIGMLAQIEGVTSSKLAERLHLDRVSTSTALRSLFEKKLVERRQDVEDGREVYVRLSPSGQQLFADLFPRIARLNVDLLDGIDAAHMDVFLQCLRRLELRGDELNLQSTASEEASCRSASTRHQ